MADFWAITTYFNPMGYARRLANYRVFRRHLNVPLITVEWAWEGGPGFQLTNADAAVLIQLRGPDLMWQKERLLNLAVAALPDACRGAAWLDCDVVFPDPTWSRRALDMLAEYAVIHLFEAAYELPPGAEPDERGRAAADRRLSLVHAAATGADAPALARQDIRKLGFLAGFAWAAPADLLRRHRFYDACVMGSGNRAIYSAGLGRFGDPIDYHRMGPAWARHYRAWAEPYYDAVRGRVRCLSGEVYHLWHGDLARRRHADRHQDFQPFAFDPAADIAVHESGCWRWNSPKHAMHDFVQAYFASRREDG
jgi:hypothetical protein